MDAGKRRPGHSWAFRFPTLIHRQGKRSCRNPLVATGPCALPHQNKGTRHEIPDHSYRKRRGRCDGNQHNDPVLPGPRNCSDSDESDAGLRNPPCCSRPLQCLPANIAGGSARLNSLSGVSQNAPVPKESGIFPDPTRHSLSGAVNRAGMPESEGNEPKPSWCK